MSSHNSNEHFSTIEIKENNDELKVKIYLY
jgi:hypothetical protein